MTWASRNIGAGRVGIAVLILFLYGMAMAALVSLALPPENKDVFVVLAGGLNTALGMVCGYYFNISGRQRSGGS